MSTKKSLKFRRVLKYISAIIFSLVIVFGYPAIFNLSTYNPKLLADASGTDTWIGFLGSYSGSIIASFVTILGVFLTLQYSRDKDKEDKEFNIQSQLAQIRPYMQIETIDDDSVRSNANYLYLPKVCFEDNGDNDFIFVYIFLSNIGLGNAIGINLKLSGIIDPGLKDFVLLKDTSIKKNLKISRSILEKNKNPQIEITFEDLVGTNYRQLVYLGYINKKLSIEEISRPEKV